MSPTLLDKGESRIRRMFGDISPRYDLLNHLLSLNIDRSWRRRTTRLVPPNGNEPILDVCTGTGDLAFEYYNAGDGPHSGDRRRLLPSHARVLVGEGLETAR